MAAAGQDADMAKLIKILTDEAPLHTKLLEAMVRRFERGGHSVAAAPSASELQMEAAKAAAIQAFRAVKADASDANKAALQNAEAAYYITISDLVKDAPEDEREFQRYILGKLKLSAIDVPGQVAAGAAAAAAPVEGAGGAHGVAPAGGAGGNAGSAGGASAFTGPEASAGGASAFTGREASAGGNAGSAGGNAGSAGGNAGSAGGNAGSAGGNAGSAGGNASAPGGNAGSAGGNAGSAGGNAGSAGGNASAPGGNAGSAGGNAGSAGGNASAPGGNAGSAGGNAGSAGGNASAPGGNAGSAGGNASAPGGNASAPGGNAGSAGGNASAPGGNASAPGGNAGSAGGNAGSAPGGAEAERDALIAEFAGKCTSTIPIANDGLCFYRAILTSLNQTSDTPASKEFAVEIGNWLEGHKDLEVSDGPVKDTIQGFYDKNVGNRDITVFYNSVGGNRQRLTLDQYIEKSQDFSGNDDLCCPKVWAEVVVAGHAAANLKTVNIIIYNDAGEVISLYHPAQGIVENTVTLKNTNGNHFDVCNASVNNAGPGENMPELEHVNAEPPVGVAAAPAPPAGPPPNPPRGVLPPPLPGKPLGPPSATAAPPPPVAAEPPLPPAAKEIFEKNPESIKRLKIEEYDTIEKYNEGFIRLFIEQMNFLKDIKGASSVTKDNIDQVSNTLKDAIFLKKVLEVNKKKLPEIEGIRNINSKLERIETFIKAQNPAFTLQSGGAKAKAKAKSRAVTPIGKRLDISLKKRSKTSKKSKSKKNKTRKSKH
jgi:hypothetical protein